MPKTSAYATAIAKVRNCTFLEILKTDENGLQVFCQICAKSFACSKSNHVGDHVGSQYHVKAANLKAPKQTQASIELRTADFVKDTVVVKKSVIFLKRKIHCTRARTYPNILFLVKHDGARG